MDRSEEWWEKGAGICKSGLGEVMNHELTVFHQLRHMIRITLCCVPCKLLHELKLQIILCKSDVLILQLSS